MNDFKKMNSEDKAQYIVNKLSLNLENFYLNILWSFLVDIDKTYRKENTYLNEKELLNYAINIKEISKQSEFILLMKKDKFKINKIFKNLSNPF